ncbi:5,10-methylenetetrahydrofolate dehydrogenase (NAD+) [Quadrisphaera granulorum]|uniref:5,10-methylenetetrahydrofolate dehydrogenase (NAD+) n=1 Tax=Quadrisphaera granulorum TaxID=317664 RepID=A0A315ZRI7_9ACTN|nr:bifunctional methylenetetrahydrofolate dehydrogenase/methenyltetrahydrofolate cyclohydrolase [Quadrisphaera granulorum]PWJ48156.1 5,10-methylenetetrahydrofolate dehydrogenase (NAD+) [Quadrisphaera granulorum]SZE98525.1 5,10-methylenetetrahydrofolate dehydrogenase (NAD+) [Quadrisphaera granulorum]
MSATVLDPSPVAAAFREEVRGHVRHLVEQGRSLRVVGLISQEKGPAATYARYAQRGFEDVGITFELRHTEAAQAEAAVAAANTDPDVDGVFLYYPLTDRAGDRWLRELVDPRKDIEGMHSFWGRLLYENERFVDPEHRHRAILPCTPLAILKLLEAAGLHSDREAAPLEGVTACVINRSDVVGRPLAAMLANDGARVHSLDLTGPLTFEPAIGRHAHDVRDSDIDRHAALAAADVVISAVPSRDFELVRGEEIREGAICVDVAEFTNFDSSVHERASVFVPRVGPLTIAMAARNLVRLASARRPG